MFTGLIETIGTINELRRSDQSLKISVTAKSDGYAVRVGESVSISGVCLTAESIIGKVISFTAVRETLRRTTFAKARLGEIVNLERALLASGRLDGHFVLGHVDAVGVIADDQRAGVSVLRKINVPKNIGKFIAQKGSIAVDGVSLTIAEHTEEAFVISLIPQTLETTTMGLKKAGDEVNIECDVLARYIERLIGRGSLDGKLIDSAEGGSLLDKLEGAGF